MYVSMFHNDFTIAIDGATFYYSFILSFIFFNTKKNIKNNDYMYVII